MKASVSDYIPVLRRFETRETAGSIRLLPPWQSSRIKKSANCRGDGIYVSFPSLLNPITKQTDRVFGSSSRGVAAPFRLLDLRATPLSAAPLWQLEQSLGLRQQWPIVFPPSRPRLQLRCIETVLNFSESSVVAQLFLRAMLPCRAHMSSVAVLQ